MKELYIWMKEQCIWKEQNILMMIYCPLPPQSAQPSIKEEANSTSLIIFEL